MMRSWWREDSPATAINTLCRQYRKTDHQVAWVIFARAVECGPRPKLGRRTIQFLAVADRHCAAKRAAAIIRRDQEAAAHVASLSEPLRVLQQTARATCIRVSADGQHVTECLHDVGGSMTWTVGHNGYTLPASFADHQARHDAIYHPGVSR